MNRFGFGSGLMFVIWISSLICACAAKKVKPGEFHPIPVAEQYRIFESLPEVTMIGFADSFSLTKEISAIEKEWISILYLERGFDLLAMSGSVFDVWLSMDLILNQGDQEGAIQQARLRGMPIGYQTAEMEKLLSWIRETRNRSEPFYLVGFGQEVASSYGWRNQFLFRTFAEVLRSYGAKKSVAQIESDLSPLLKLKKCKESGFPKSNTDSEGVKNAISSLGVLVAEVAGSVQERFPGHRHAMVLKALPAYFLSALELCQAGGESGKRIELEAKSIEFARSECSKSGRILLLGDFELLRNSKSTLGGALKAKFGDGLYTIATIPLSGEVIARTAPPGSVRIQGNETPVQSLFQGIESPSFIPFASLSPRAKRWVPLFQKSTAWIEGNSKPVEWSKEVNAFLLVPGISPSQKWYLDHLQFKKEW
ncbi:MAG: hypothetical protein KGP28_12405 [Bdellovibrionales bacterium]|nr:hypothetical protein [Bdellovibrionales bacterium]